MTNDIETTDETMTEAELVAALADRIATATGGEVWSKGDHTRVYVRDGKKEGYVSIDSSKSVSYDRSIDRSKMYRPMVEAGIVSLDDISVVL